MYSFLLPLHLDLFMFGLLPDDLSWFLLNKGSGLLNPKPTAGLLPAPIVSSSALAVMSGIASAFASFTLNSETFNRFKAALSLFMMILKKSM
jgi:hypothetical protein